MQEDPGLKIRDLTHEDRAALVLAGGMAFAAGIAALFGRLIHSDALIRIHPTFVPITLGSAVAFVGVGCALFFAGAGYPRLSALLGAVSCIYGAWGPLPDPGAVSIPLAFAAMAVGFIALGILHGRVRLRAFGWSGSLAASLGISALAGYAWGIHRSSVWAPHALMSAHEAAVFLIAGAVFVRAGWKRENPNLPLVMVMCLGMLVASQIHLALDHADRSIGQKNFESDAHNRALVVGSLAEADPAADPELILRRALGRLASSATDVYIVENDGQGASRVLGYFPSRRNDPSARALNAEEIRRYPDFVFREKINGTDGPEREVVCLYRPELDSNRKPWLPWAASGSVASFSALLAWMLWSAVHRARIVSDLVQQRTAQLEKANQALEEEVRRRRIAEARSEEQKRNLEKANVELDSFVHTASHDLRAPLRAIASFASFLEEDCGARLDARGRDHLTEIRTGAIRMDRLIDDLLTLSRLSRVRNPYAVTPVGDIVRDALERIAFDVRSAGARVTVAADLPAILCDRVKLTEVFLNLIANAVKFSKKKGADDTAPAAEAPQVQVGWKDRGDQWEFWVKDNGIGIEPKYQDQIFGIFKRLHPNGVYEGTGVGLTIVKRIVDDHGGRVWVESEPGHGATFRLTLPKVPGVRA